MHSPAPALALAAVCLLAAPAPLHSAQVGDRLPHGRKVVCYVGTWATYRVDGGAFNVDDIDPRLCSHVVYAFAGLDPASNSIKSLDNYNDLEENYGKGSYKKLTSLKKKYPHLKVTLAIGGWNEGSENYSRMAAGKGRRKWFANSVKEFLREYGFDGLDLDWEFPTMRGGQPEDKENFVELVKDLRKELPHGEFLLTAALGAGLDTIISGYDLPALNRELDFIHLMSYDYHGSWESKTGANAPLHSGTPNDTLTVERSVHYLLSNGVSRDKLVVGVPFYGRTFLLKDPDSNGTLGEPSLQNRGFQGPYTKTDGFLGYNEICRELKHGNWTIHWDDASMTPFASQRDMVIAYDDARSLKEKVKFAIGDENVAGIMVWSMDTDDFRGDCAVPGDKPPHNYPLLHAINEAIMEAVEERASHPSSAVRSQLTDLSLIICLVLTSHHLLHFVSP